MRTIDDLRASLVEHAEVTDDGLGGRSARVVARGRVVRRRRRVGVVGAAAAVVVVAGALTMLPEHDAVGPAGEVVGVSIPETMTATGWSFDYSEKVEARSGIASLTLPASPEPRLVSWATEREDQQVEVSTNFSDSFASTRPDFTDHVWVRPGAPAELEIAADGALGLAVYSLSDDEPDGISDFGITYRQQVGDRTLLNATFGGGTAPSAGAGTEVQLGTGALYVAPHCTFIGGKPPRFSVEIDGEEQFTGSCPQRVDSVGFVDPGAPAEQVPVYNVPGEPGDTVKATVRWVRDGRPAPDRVAIAVGVYSGPSDGPVVLGEQVDEIVERNGHTWRLTEVAEGGLADGVDTAVPETDERLLVGFRARLRGNDRVSVVGRVDGKRTDAVYGFGGGSEGGTGIFEVVPADGAEVVLSGRGAGAGDEGALLFYELAD